MKSQLKVKNASRNAEAIATGIDIREGGERMYQLVAELYPICRSITGKGVRETLTIVSKHIPLDIREVSTGTRVFDWTVPKEWNITGGYIRDCQGRKVVDFNNSNLHVLNYSVPVKMKLSLNELKKHLYTIPEHPDWIPYRTSYYKEDWGFSLAHNQLQDLSDGEYEVFIDSSLKDGHLSYGEYLVKGESDAEVLISTHVCHPSLANDNLSGVALSVFTAQYLSSLSLRYSYRFLFVPGTIGPITWLAANENNIDRIKHGLVVACVGDRGKSTYKKSRKGDAEIDKTVIHVLKNSSHEYEIAEFSPYGYDERQYCSPGFDLPVGCFMKTPHGKFPEYHTSADNLDFVQPQYMADSLTKLLAVIRILEGNQTYLNRNPKCEPQLGRRGLYGSIGGQADGRLGELAMLWILNLSDGKHSLLDIADKSGLKFDLIKQAADLLEQHDLLNRIQGA